MIVHDSSNPTPTQRSNAPVARTAPFRLCMDPVAVKMLARKLQHQATSGAASDARSVSVRSLAPSIDSRPDASPQWLRWLGLDALLQLANTYYASRMAIVTAVSCLSMVLLWVFVDTYWLWVGFQVTNTALGVSALPGSYLYSVVSTRNNSDDSPEAAARDDGDDQQRRSRQRTSFSFLRSSFHAIETKLEPFLLKRSKILRLCESIVVIQTVMLYWVLIVVVIIVWTLREGILDPVIFNISTFLSIFSVICVHVQTKEFDRLRAHEQLQLGFGLSEDVLEHAHVNRKKRSSASSRMSAMFTLDDSERTIQSVRSDGESFLEASAVSDLGHVAALVDSEIRHGLYEAALSRDHRKARALLEVLERALESKDKVKMFLLKTYDTPTLWLYAFAYTTRNPLHIACRIGDAVMAEILLEGGINPNQLDKTQGEPFSLRVLYEFCQGRPKNITNVLGSPLHVAVAHGHTHLIALLVKHGANLDVIAKTSFFSRSMRVPPIFLADSEDVVECLIHHRANFLVVPGKGNSMSVTVLQRAMLNDRSDLEHVFAEWGADVALTPLHEAAAAGDVATVKHYLALGIPPDQLGEFQDGVNMRTSLHWACIMGRVGVVTELLHYNAAVNALDSRKRTPLHWAARHNHISTMKELLAAGADPQLEDENGLTPLAFAAAGGLLDGAAVELFMEHGVKVDAQLRNRAADTCLHLALRSGHREAALALIQHGHADLTSLNGHDESAVSCCASFELLYDIKMSSKWTDIVISYDSTYRQLAEHLKSGIEENFLTVFMRDADDDAKESMRVMEKASAVVCVLSPGFARNAICMEELSHAKSKRVPVMAISTDAMEVPEELRMYLFTRQLVPFRDAISAARRKSTATPDGTHEFRFKIDDELFRKSLQNLIDGLRDEVERRNREELARVRSGVEDVELMSMHVPPRPGSEGMSLAASEDHWRSSDPERGGSTSTLDRSSTPRGTRSFTRSETARPKTVNDVVKDILGRRRRVSVQPLLLSSERNLSTASIFLSHGDCHTEFVTKLYTELHHVKRLPVTLDSGLHVSSMKERILAAKDAILQCSIFLVVLSEKSVQTELVSDQLAFAEDKGKYIVPIYYTQKPGVVDKTVRLLLDSLSGNPALICEDGLSYGRGFDVLFHELESERERLESSQRQSEDEEEKHEFDWVPVSPAAKKAAALIRSRVGNRSILV